MKLQNQSSVGFKTEVSQQRVWPVNLLGHYKNSTYYLDLDIELQFFCTFFVTKIIYAQFFVANTINAHFSVAKMIRAHLFCCKNNLHTLFCRKNYLHTFFCHKKEFTHLFFVAKTIYALFCRENDLRTSSGKFLRVESCHPESSDFLGL